MSKFGLLTVTDIADLRTMLQEVIVRQSEILRQQAELLELLHQSPPAPPKPAPRPIRAIKRVE